MHPGDTLMASYTHSNTKIKCTMFCSFHYFQLVLKGFSSTNLIIHSGYAHTPRSSE